MLKWRLLANSSVAQSQLLDMRRPSMIEMSQEDPLTPENKTHSRFNNFFYIEDRRYEGTLTATGIGYYLSTATLKRTTSCSVPTEISQV